MAEKIIIGNAELWHGDCAEIIDFIQPDCIVTDPPYGLGSRMQGGRWGNSEKYKDMISWDIKPDDDLLFALAKKSKIVVYWGGNYFGLPPSRCWLVWDKQNSVPTMADCELAWTNLDANTRSVSLQVGQHKSGHPTEKPIRLMEWTLNIINARGLIFDPFMGSGTTGVACMTAGLSFVGVEREKNTLTLLANELRARRRNLGCSRDGKRAAIHR